MTGDQLRRGCDALEIHTGRSLIPPPIVSRTNRRGVLFNSERRDLRHPQEKLKTSSCRYTFV